MVWRQWRGYSAAVFRVVARDTVAGEGQPFTLHKECRR